MDLEVIIIRNPTLAAPTVYVYGCIEFKYKCNIFLYSKICELNVVSRSLSRRRASLELAYPRGYSISIPIYPSPRKITTDG